jgi:hypothetical protein
MEQTESAFQNAFFTSVALTISTLIYGRTPGNLSLVDGLLVTFLPIVITIGAVNDTYALSHGNMTLKLTYLLHLLLCVAFGLLFWVQVNTYGTTPGCNLNSSVKFVVFGHSVTATSRGLKGFGIFLFSFIGVTLPFVTFLLTIWTIPEREDRASWWWTVTPITAWVYEVVTIEEIIHRNGLNGGTGQWSYGQTFALVLLIGPAFDLVSAIWRRKTAWEPVSGTCVFVIGLICGT